MIPFNRPHLTGREFTYIQEAVAAGQLAGNGRFTERCHRWLERELSAPRALLTHSATAALEMAALLLDVRPGDEVIMPSFTFVSTANADSTAFWRAMGFGDYLQLLRRDVG